MSNLPAGSHCHCKRARDRGCRILATWERPFDRTDRVQGYIRPRFDRFAEEVLGRGRVGWIHPDCGFWMLKRSVADRKIEALVKGRDLYLGRR